ncbi:MAG: glycosyltransferase family 39 protein [Sphingobacteriaceae bacterium]|nr:glycosyltransferase family 39 protein [Sphingobacteriaceae bacterium]
MIVGLFGDTVQGMHTGFMWVNILSMVFLYFAARNLFSPVAGVITAATFAFVSLTPNLSGFTVQAEHGVAFFISMGLLFYSLARSKGKLMYYMLMGLAMGCAFMVKQPECSWHYGEVFVDH